MVELTCEETSAKSFRGLHFGTFCAGKHRLIIAGLIPKTVISKKWKFYNKQEKFWFKKQQEKQTKMEVVNANTGPEFLVGKRAQFYDENM